MASNVNHTTTRLPPPAASLLPPPPPPPPPPTTVTPPSLGPLHYDDAAPLTTQVFNLPTAVQRVLRGHIAGLNAATITSIFNGTFKALELHKLKPDLLQRTYGDDEQQYLMYVDGVLSTTTQAPHVAAKDKLAPYTNPVNFTRFWLIYSYVMTSLFGRLSPNLVYGLQLHHYNLIHHQVKHQWNAVMNYHFTWHQHLLDDGHTALLSPESWATMDPGLMGSYLGGDTYKQMCSAPVMMCSAQKG
ncbi:hypothetical protein BJ508DRAFT_314151 [Ascobolus immersus RN42]|uniref:Uncharacterized protein n=1 Tax=Ascobolus immersus RN42 TaxID=1160509 RepID=A0A3N4HG15_ASCIM|nr:hypothetical protein BJ508DRAFT_314151 [Ascobolus immersus RN42]